MNGSWAWKNRKPRVSAASHNDTIFHQEPGPCRCLKKDSAKM
jgi:hypothetical protein